MSRISEQPKKTGFPPLLLRRLPGRYAICRLVAGSSIPDWAMGGSGFVSITRTEDELSIVIDEERAPEGGGGGDGTVVESGWIALRIVGRLDFGIVGVLAKLTGALAAAEVPVCAVSTYDTDILLVKAGNADRAAAALSTVARIEP